MGSGVNWPTVVRLVVQMVRKGLAVIITRVVNLLFPGVMSNP